jgi:probable rRNA maturation factor
LVEVAIVVDEPLAGEVLEELLSDLAPVAQGACAHQGVLDGELTILITDDERMASLNKRHRGISRSTDVLSFPSGDSPTIPDMVRYLGDIAISLPRAQEQASTGGHSARDELCLLVVHGTLHLLGHDHAESDEKARMWAAQGEILGELGISISISD